MATRLVCAAFLAVAALSNSGCGTFANMSSSHADGGQRIYGGVRLDCVMTWAALSYTFGHNDGSHSDATLEGIPDLPLSAIGDTVTLPFTITASIRRCLNAIQTAQSSR